MSDKEMIELANAALFQAELALPPATTKKQEEVRESLVWGRASIQFKGQTGKTLTEFYAHLDF